MVVVPNWSEQLCQSLAALRQNGDMCDVILEGSDGQGIQCHSIVLAAVSPYFKDTLVWSEEGCCKIKIGSVSGQIWQSIVEFIYTGKVEHLAGSEVLSVARKLRIPALLKAISEQLGVSDSDYGSSKTSRQSASSTPGTLNSDINQAINFSFPARSSLSENNTENQSHVIHSNLPQSFVASSCNQLGSQNSSAVQLESLQHFVKKEPPNSYIEVSPSEAVLSHQNDLAPPPKEMPPLEPLLNLKIQNVTSIIQGGPNPQFPFGEIPYPPRNRKKQTSRKSTSPKKRALTPSPPPPEESPKRGRGRGRPRGSGKKRQRSSSHSSDHSMSPIQGSRAGPFLNFDQTMDMEAHNQETDVIQSATNTGPPPLERIPTTYGRGKGRKKSKGRRKGRARGRRIISGTGRGVSIGRGRGRGVSLGRISGHTRGRGRGIQSASFRMPVTLKTFCNTEQESVDEHLQKYELDLEGPGLGQAARLDLDPDDSSLYGKKRRFKCKYCTDSFDTMALLYYHKSTEHIVGGYSCKICKQVFHAPAYLMKHKKLVHGIEAVKKREYTYVPINSRKKAVPNLEVTKTPFDNNAYEENSVCGPETSDNNAAKYHCEHCTETFQAQSRLVLHMKFNHQQKNKARPRKKIIGPKVKPVVSRMRSKYFHCKICFRVFRSPAQLRWHKVREHDTTEMLTPEKLPVTDEISKNTDLEEEQETKNLVDDNQIRDVPQAPGSPITRQTSENLNVPNAEKDDEDVETKELSVTLVPIDNITRSLNEANDNSDQALSSDDDKTVDLNFSYEENGPIPPKVEDVPSKKIGRKSTTEEVTTIDAAPDGNPSKLKETADDSETKLAPRSSRKEGNPLLSDSTSTTDCTCTVCHKVFNNTVQLHWHKVKSHREESSVSTDSLTTPRPTHPRIRQYMCKVCFRVLGSPGALRWHRVRKHGFHDGRKVKGHRGQKTAQKGKRAHANDSECITGTDHVQSDIVSTSASIENGCTILPPSLANRPRFICEVCKKTFLFEDNYKRHCKMHVGGKGALLFARFKCPECDVRFTRKDNMKYHVRHQHSQLALECQECGEPLSSKHSLKEHMAEKHPQGMAFKCDLCHRGFNKQASLATHIKIQHEGIKDYECEKCGKKFAHRFTLERHSQQNCHGKEPTEPTPGNKPDLVTS